MNFAVLGKAVGAMILSNILGHSFPKTYDEEFPANATEMQALYLNMTVPQMKRRMAEARAADVAAQDDHDHDHPHAGVGVDTWWWSQETSDKYKQELSCIERKYYQFNVTIDGQPYNINGYKTRETNVRVLGKKDQTNLHL